jgi:predicted nucleic acid-binding Zn ribbon protein
MRPKRRLEKLSGTIEKLLASRGLGARLKEYRVLAVWDRAVGGVIAGHARPATVRGRKLTVTVDSSAWMQQLTLLRPEIIAKLNRMLGAAAVESVTFRLGEVEPPARRPRAAPTPLPDLDAAERARVAERVAGIADEGVREALRHLMELDLRNRKRKKE